MKLNVKQTASCKVLIIHTKIHFEFVERDFEQQRLLISNKLLHLLP